MVKKSVVFFVIALITLSITNLESKQPKNKYVAVLACQDDSIRQTLYIKKITSKNLYFSFITERIYNKKILFTLKGVAVIDNPNWGLDKSYDECDDFGENDYPVNRYSFKINLPGKNEVICEYWIRVSIMTEKAKVLEGKYRDCIYMPPGYHDVCIGTLRRIK